MSQRRSLPLALVALAFAGLFSFTAAAQTNSKIQHVLLISIDGMHSLDFANCAKGVPVYGNNPYCPHLASLSSTGVHYLQALTPKPSDSFPGLTAQITGGTPRSAGMYYDVSYDRALSPPKKTTPYGIVGGEKLCPSVIGTQVGFDEEIDFNYLKLDSGKPNGSSGVNGINPDYLPRDPQNGCAPVYPHSFIRANTIFNVVKNAGGYTAWSDKHPSYDFTNGPSGDGVVDLWSPEINSIPVPIAAVQGCSPLPDPGAAQSSNAWTDSFQNIRCYDQFKVQAVLNWIDGKTHDGSTTAPVPNLFGMNFQAVSVGQKLVEGSLGLTGGYVDSVGTPTSSLFDEIQYVDTAVGQMVSELKKQGLLDSTLIVISAKHGQSPIDPNRVLRIPADAPSDEPPSQVISPAGVGPGLPVAQADEDDVSLIWLTDQSQTASSVATLEANEALFGEGQIFAGTALTLQFNNPLTDSRTPDIIVAPNVGVVYTGGKKKVSEHGGFAYDDRNVLLIVSNPSYKPSTFVDQVETRQIAPTIVKALGLDPNSLSAVKSEHTETLPGLPFTQK
ncbi:MAG TPA: alkaline phosphatase family protein [Terriglobales bacterium]|nr:alkaline phosphatase family protein [Terriglobales bacterium]